MLMRIIVNMYLKFGFIKLLYKLDLLVYCIIKYIYYLYEFVRGFLDNVFKFYS